VDRNQFRRNCERVTGETEKRGMGFRAHVKSESRDELRAAGEERVAGARRTKCMSKRDGR
jgi:hypothetical protein